MLLTNSLLNAHLFPIMMKENAKLKQDIVQLENSVTERLGYLQRYKETAAYKISSLQSKMATTVPVEELNKANRFQEEMTMKYAQLLHHQETDIMSSHTIGQLQVCTCVCNHDLYDDNSMN